jgi:hypothetical protein
MRKSFNLKRQHFTKICPNTKAPSWGTLQGCLLHCQAKGATHNWTDLDKAMCSGNGDMGLWLLGQRKKIEAVPPSNDVVHSRVADVPSNIL